jgi:hypothetical protein
MDSPLLRDKPLECEVSVYSNSENVIFAKIYHGVDEGAPWPF